MRARLLFFCVAALSACPTEPVTPADGGAGVDPEATSALGSRFLPDVLPWKVSPDATAAGLTVEFGLNGVGAAQEPRYKPVVLDARTVAVVFPPADRVGFDVAWGGFEQPWQRVALLDVAPRAVASLDAVADATGTLWFAARLRDRREKLVLARWKPGMAPVVERLEQPTVLNLVPVPYLETCNDTTLGVAPDGAVHVVVRADPQPLETKLFHGRRRPGESAFTWHQVVDGRRTQAPAPANASWDFGCRSSLAFDEQGRAVLATLLQQTTEARASTRGRTSAVFLEGRDGRFWAKDGAFMTIQNDQGDGLQRGHLEVRTHPSGFLFGGPARAFEPTTSGVSPWVYLDAWSPVRSPRGFTGEARVRDDYRFAGSASELLIAQAGDEKRAFGRGGKLLADGCGNFSLVVTDWAEADRWLLGTLGPRCEDDPAPAPVFRSGFRGQRSASFAHGQHLPFELGLCLDAESNLGVCFGGHLGTRAREQTPSGTSRATALPAVVDLVSASVDGGAVEVTLSAPAPQPGSIGTLYDLDLARPLSGTWTLKAGTPSTYVLSRAPNPGHLHRLVVNPQTELEGADRFPATWQLPAGRWPVVDFRTAGDAGLARADSWASEFQLQQQNPDGGRPEFVLDDGVLARVGTEPLRLHLTGRVAWDFGRTPTGVGRIERLDGGRLDGGDFEVPADATWVDVPLPFAPEEQQAFRVVLPAVFDRDGRQLVDTEVSVRTGWLPLFVTGVVPADGATVPAPATLEVLVNRPDPERSWNATYFEVESLHADGGVQASVPVTFAAQPFRVVLTPATPLAPASAYVVFLRTGTSVRTRLGGFSTLP